MHNRTPREGELFASAKICAAIGKGSSNAGENKTGNTGMVQFKAVQMKGA